MFNEQEAKGLQKRWGISCLGLVEFPSSKEQGESLVLMSSRLCSHFCYATTGVAHGNNWGAAHPFQFLVFHTSLDQAPVGSCCGNSWLGLHSWGLLSLACVCSFSHWEDKLEDTLRSKMFMQKHQAQARGWGMTWVASNTSDTYHLWSLRTGSSTEPEVCILGLQHPR